MNNQELNVKRQWLFSCVIIVSLTIGSSIMFHLNKFLINVFIADSIGGLAINSIEGAILVALEMGIIPIFAVIGFAIMNKWPVKQLLNISWKIFISGSILGALIGSTYTLGSQSLICGIIH